MAAPVAGKIFERIFEFSTYDSKDESVKKVINLESYIGMSLTQAAASLSQLNLQYLVQGDGDYVTGQIPAPGSEVNEGDVVLLIFD